MMHHHGSVMALSFLLAAPSAQADELEKVEEKIKSRWSEVKSVRAKARTVMDLGDEGRDARSIDTGTFAFQRDGSETRWREESTRVMKVEAGETAIEIKTTKLVLCDGEYVYGYVDSNGAKTAVKTSVDQFEQGWAAPPLAKARETCDLKLIGEAKHEGEPVWVIELKPRQVPSRTEIWFRQDCGFPVKTVAYEGNSDEPMVTHLFTDVELNAPIPADRFVFEPREGVEVIEMDAEAAGKRLLGTTLRGAVDRP